VLPTSGMRVYLRSLVDKNLHLEGIAASFFKSEYFIVYHEDTGRMFISIQWLAFGRSLRESVAHSTQYSLAPYTVLSSLGVFTFCTCCKILICLVCFVASFKLSFV